MCRPKNRLTLAIFGVGLTFTLLTNAYYFRVFEPALSRRVLSVVVWGILGGYLLFRRHGLPSFGRIGFPLLLTVVVMLAYVLRDWGIRGGLPVSYVADEYDHVHAALKMIKSGDFNPHSWYYPSLQRYLTALTYFVVALAQIPSGRWASIQQVTVEDMLYWGRWVSVIAGTATVLVTFFLGRRLFGARVGLPAAALVAVFPGAITYSQLNKPDAMMALAATIGVLVTLIYLEHGGWKLALAAGSACGLTIAAKYNGAIVILPFVAAVGFRHGTRALAKADIYLGAFGAIAAFFLACPFVLVDFALFSDHVAFDLYSYGFLGWDAAEGVDNWAHHAGYLWRQGTGPIAFLLGCCGLAATVSKLDRTRTVFVMFPVLYFSHYSSQRTNWPDNLTALYPFVAILAVHCLAEIGSALSRTRVGRAAPLLVAISFAAALLVPLQVAIRRNIEANRPDTGNEARRWIERQLPPGTRIVVERLAPVPDQQRFHVLLEARVIGRTLEYYQKEGFQYLIVSSMVYERFGPGHRQTDAYARLFSRCPLVVEFVPVPNKLEGPTIRILKVPGE